MAAALQNTEYGDLIFHASASDATLALRDVHVARLATDERFVHFDVATFEEWGLTR